MQLNKTANSDMKPLSRAKTMRVKPPAPQPPQPQVQPEAESRPRVLNRAKSSPNLLLGLEVTPEVGSSRASLLSDSLINLADGERPSKSRRKVAEMIDDLNVALGLKKADTAERLEKKRRKQEAKERLKGTRVWHLLIHESVVPPLAAITG